MKKFIVIIFVLAISSCIPYKVAPKFKNQDYKVMLAKKFQKQMPRETSFIFNDPKDANEFYNYINKKYRLNNVDVGVNVPFQIEDQILYLTYYEAERTDETFNLPLVVADDILDNKTGIKIFENNYTSRTGHWYIILTVYDEDIKNCLKNNHPLKEKTIQYLRKLKAEYLATSNYEELLFTKNPNTFTLGFLIQLNLEVLQTSIYYNL
ncbi:hypothetical protein [Winogradskyella endarachnes]|uniref:Lipoprotein n=1 Tax=Winogradskyella endarachnes TaxID=2681965 RepID=A0A6L6U576_9FLAO|nr:hypothetical protein [Winogradskyella endarachnes]MUU77313.1 hypothetical protein [Winogradskyella endarachnes]